MIYVSVLIKPEILPFFIVHLRPLHSRRDIANRRIKPHIKILILLTGYKKPKIRPCPCDIPVFQPILYPVEHIVFHIFLYVLVCCEPLFELFFILCKAKKIMLLCTLLRLRMTYCAISIQKLTCLVRCPALLTRIPVLVICPALRACAFEEPVRQVARALRAIHKLYFLCIY